MKLLIGRSSRCHIKLNNPNVSNEHCHLTLADEANSIFEIENISEQGTYKKIGGQYRKFNKLKFSNTDFIKLGNFEISGKDLIQKYFGFANKGKTNFKQDFERMKPEFDRYWSFLDRINARKVKMPIIVRIISIALPVAVVLAINKMDWLKYAISISIVLGTVGMFVFPPQSKKNMESKNLKDAEFSEILKCPRCKSSLLAKNYQFWLAKGTCNNSQCEAKFK